MAKEQSMVLWSWQKSSSMRFSVIINSCGGEVSTWNLQQKGPPLVTLSISAHCEVFFKYSYMTVVFNYNEACSDIVTFPD